MSGRDWTIRVEDILDAIGAITDYTRGMTFQDFAGDRKTLDAVVYNLVVIGEAAARIPKDVTADCTEVPWEKMRGMRNLIVHAYFTVQKQIVWDTVQEDLPRLVPLLKQVLKRKT